MPTDNHDIIFFDGLCNLCNGAVKFIIVRDIHRRFKYASLQSEIGIQTLEYSGFSNLDSILVKTENKYLVKSQAALYIMKNLSLPYKVLSHLGSILPRFFTDFLYDYIAKNRYQWFGKKDECMIPSAEQKDLFL